MEAKIQAVWCLNVLKILEVFGIELLFHRPIRSVKTKFSSKPMRPVVLISSSIGESDGSKSNEKFKDYHHVSLDILLYGGYGKNGMTLGPRPSKAPSMTM